MSVKTVMSIEVSDADESVQMSHTVITLLSIYET